MVCKRETSDSLEIIKSATTMLRAIYNPKYKYKKAGIILGKIKPEKNTQEFFFFTDVIYIFQDLCKIFTK